MHGRLNGYHVGSLDRKRTWSWAQWFVRRSEVEKLPLPWGCEGARDPVERQGGRVDHPGVCPGPGL